jgi:hypothetical protein
MKAYHRLALATAMATTVAIVPVFASSHREAPGITERPKVDNTDVYAFRSYEPGRDAFVTILANFQPDQSPNSGPNYFTMDPKAIYEIHVDSDGDGVEDLTYQFKFTNALKGGTGITLSVGGKTLPIALREAGPSSATDQSSLGESESYTITQIVGGRRSGTKTAVTSSTGATSFTKPLDNVGNKSIPDYTTYANQYVYAINVQGCSVAGRAFVGQRAEAFAVNLGQVFDLVNFVPIEGDSAPGAGDGKGFPGGITQNRANDDLVGKKNVTTIALELPIACLKGSGNGVIGVWSTASLPQAELRDPTPTYAVPAVEGGAYVQVSRLGSPLVNELVIGLNQKDLFNASAPSADAQFADYVTNPTFPAILDLLFRAPVNATLGTNLTNLAPNNFPRADLVATFLTGIKTLNQQAKVTPSEMIRLNTGIAPTPQATQSTFGVAGDDLAGYPNGRRPGDDAVDITLRVAMGRLCYPVPINHVSTDLGLCTAANAPVGNVAFTDGAPISARDLQNVFPYLNTPIPGSPHTVRNTIAAQPAKN